MLSVAAKPSKRLKLFGTTQKRNLMAKRRLVMCAFLLLFYKDSLVVVESENGSWTRYHTCLLFDHFVPYLYVTSSGNTIGPRFFSRYSRNMVRRLETHILQI